jgi:exonuclease V gamma subunit
MNSFNKEVLRQILSSGRDQREDVLLKGIKVNEILDFFSSLGYTCQADGEIRGKSGARHHFDIIASKDSEIIVIDIVSFRTSILDTPASDLELAEQSTNAALQMRVKGWDCGVYQMVLLQLSSTYCGSPDEERRNQYDPFEQFLKESNITMVCSGDVETAAKRIKSIINNAEIVQEKN